MNDQQNLAVSAFLAAVGNTLSSVGNAQLCTPLPPNEVAAFKDALGDLLAAGAIVALAFGIDADAVDERARETFLFFKERMPTSSALAPVAQPEQSPLYSAEALRCRFEAERITELPHDKEGYWGFAAHSGLLWLIDAKGGAKVASFEDMAKWLADMPDDAAREAALTKRSSVAMGGG